MADETSERQTSENDASALENKADRILREIKKITREFRGLSG